jgi:hypothetical protein
MENVELKKYSLPLYEDGVKTKWTVDFVEGDEKYKFLMKLHGEIPFFVNVNLKKEKF